MVLATKVLITHVGPAHLTLLTQNMCVDVFPDNSARIAKHQTRSRCPKMYSVSHMGASGLGCHTFCS